MILIDAIVEYLEHIADKMDAFVAVIESVQGATIADVCAVLDEHDAQWDMRHSPVKSGQPNAPTSRAGREDSPSRPEMEQ